jgi:hypothetical protein
MLTDIDVFLAVSARLTGFTHAELRDTRLAERYHSLVLEKAGQSRFDALAEAVMAAGDPVALHDQGALELAREVVRVWYTGVWSMGSESPFVVSRRAYAEGLVWKTFSGAPPGTAAPGFGSWSSPPRTPAFPGNAG